MTEQTKSTTTAAVAGVAGAVVGAGVAVAATKLMSDKNMRDKVKNTLTEVKDQVLEALDHQGAVASLKGGSAKQVAGKSQSKTSGSSKTEKSGTTL